MAQLTDAQLAYLHSEVGTSADETDLQDRFDRLGSAREVVLEVLRQRLADFTASPASVSIPDGPSMSTSGNITALQRQLDRVDSEGDPDDTGAMPEEGVLVRVPMRGRVSR